MTYKRVPPYSKIEDLSRLKDIDAEYFSMSIRERIQIAVEAKQNGTRRGPYFLHAISNVVDELLVEGQVTDQDRMRSSEVFASLEEMSRSFADLWKLASGNSTAETDLVNVMWGAFMIGLACDREGLDKSEAKKILDMQHMKGARENIKAYDEKRSDYDLAFEFAFNERRKLEPLLPLPETIKEAGYFVDLVQKYFDDHKKGRLTDAKQRRAGGKKRNAGDEKRKAGEEKQETEFETHTATPYSIVQAAIRMAIRNQNET